MLNVITNLAELVAALMYCYCCYLVWILFAVCIQDTVLVVVECLTSTVLTVTITQLHPISEEEVLFTIDGLFTDCMRPELSVSNISVLSFTIKGILSTLPSL